MCARPLIINSLTACSSKVQVKLHTSVSPCPAEHQRESFRCFWPAVFMEDSTANQSKLCPRGHLLVFRPDLETVLIAKVTTITIVRGPSHWSWTYKNSCSTYFSLWIVLQHVVPSLTTADEEEITEDRRKKKYRVPKFCRYACLTGKTASDFTNHTFKCELTYSIRQIFLGSH